jgi:cytochrome c peroxidase
MTLLRALFLISFLFSACQSDDESELVVPNNNQEEPSDTTKHEEDVIYPNLPEVPFNYASPDLPNYFFAPPIQGQDNMPGDNLTSDWGATLGRVLFYDKNLSANQTVACASCHHQETGFSDTEVLSVGFEGGLTGRHSMSLTQARYYASGAFFWDERAATLEEQVLMPIQDEVEMGMELDALVAHLESIPYYPDLFQHAFGSPEITSDRISLALAQFVRSIVSSNSRFDEGMALIGGGPNFPTTDFPNFTASENLGKALFFAPENTCASCHGTTNFVAPGARNNGLDANSEDLGLGGITGNLQENGLFKVPSLRNVAVRPPYMHDGRFASLEEVVEHYNSGIQPHPNLAPQLRQGPGPNGQPIRLNLTEAEKQALVDFMMTLTDQSLLTDDKFSDPF